jgi:hypothetical protein
VIGYAFAIVIAKFNHSRKNYTVRRYFKGVIALKIPEMNTTGVRVMDHELWGI